MTAATLAGVIVVIVLLLLLLFPVDRMLELSNMAAFIALYLSPTTLTHFRFFYYYYSFNYRFLSKILSFLFIFVLVLHYVIFLMTFQIKIGSFFV